MAVRSIGIDVSEGAPCLNQESAHRFYHYHKIGLGLSLDDVCNERIDAESMQASKRGCRAEPQRSCLLAHHCSKHYVVGGSAEGALPSLSPLFPCQLS